MTRARTAWSSCPPPRKVWELTVLDGRYPPRPAPSFLPIHQSVSLPCRGSQACNCLRRPHLRCQAKAVLSSLGGFSSVLGRRVGTFY
ncbi:hypothetical protein T439DRAFT_33362 [Meredithblackwellia eburnea MCA 4105]